MDTIVQDKYIEQLQEIKERSLVFQAFSKGTANALYQESTIEVETFQLRRILEILAFTFVLGIGERAIPAYASFVKYKNSEKFLSELFELKADFFPRPIIQTKIADGEWQWDTPMEGAYLNKMDFLTLFEHCNLVLEPRRIGALLMSLLECKAANIKWYAKIVGLLQAHLVHSEGFAYLYQMGSADASPTCTPFKEISGVGEKPIPIEIKSASLDMSLADHLRRQLEYLRRSCELYDAGHFDDAIRLAVSIRVLIHDTDKSTSLLKLMNVKSTVKLATSFGLAQKLPNGMKPTSIIPLFVSSSEGGVSVPFALSLPLTLLTVDEWWNETVWMQNTTLTRKQIVLACANKDGGAHIEESAPQSIVDLRRGLSNVVSLKIGEVEVGTPSNYHFILLRQFAHELFNSASLTVLAS